jgi:hypothetical protein
MAAVLIGPHHQNNKAVRVGRGIAVPNLIPRYHAPAALPPGKTRYPLYRSLGGENLAPTGIRSQDCPIRNESIYRLSYPDR